MDFTRITRVVEHNNSVGFEMTGARDLNVADSMCAHAGQNMLFHKRFLIGVLVPHLGSDDDQVCGKIKIAKRFVIHPLQDYRRGFHSQSVTQYRFHGFWRKFRWDRTRRILPSGAFAFFLTFHFLNHGVVKITRDGFGDGLVGEFGSVVVFCYLKDKFAAFEAKPCRSGVLKAQVTATVLK
jgi:hypothetical protein